MIIHIFHNRIIHDLAKGVSHVNPYYQASMYPFFVYYTAETSRGRKLKRCKFSTPRPIAQTHVTTTQQDCKRKKISVIWVWFPNLNSLAPTVSELWGLEVTIMSLKKTLILVTSSPHISETVGARKLRFGKHTHMTEIFFRLQSCWVVVTWGWAIKWQSYYYGP